MLSTFLMNAFEIVHACVLQMSAVYCHQISWKLSILAVKLVTLKSQAIPKVTRPLTIASHEIIYHDQLHILYIYACIFVLLEPGAGLLATSSSLLFASQSLDCFQKNDLLYRLPNNGSYNDGELKEMTYNGTII